MASHPAGDDAEDAPTDDTRHSDLVTLEAQVSPRHLAVLVVDMQNDFCAENGYLHRLYGIAADRGAAAHRRPDHGGRACGPDGGRACDMDPGDL